jgi:nucleoside 2-deoxyribosyltransferase
MMDVVPIALLVGEVFVDFTMTKPGLENKLRLGGIAHAARGFWALDKPFSAAVILPQYLEAQTRKYLQALGCVDFFVMGYVRGAPNVTIIADPTEVSDQEYETLLRDEKTVVSCDVDLTVATYTDILIFPGSYDLLTVCAALPSEAALHLDVAYDVNNQKDLVNIKQHIGTVFLSTSSVLFQSLPVRDFNAVINAFMACDPSVIILKENRGGARMLIAGTGVTEALPAQLGTTVNSVGVGDVFASAYVAYAKYGHIAAAWRASYTAASYSQTTFPDLFKSYVVRDLKLSLDDMQQLGGTFLPWEARQEYQIYFAAPDFSYGDRVAIDRAIASLAYHNFLVRRPVFENGELPPGSGAAALERTYHADYDLLQKCALLFAVPTARDPGTLVEVGIAIEAGIPVVVYDPDQDNANTMVMAGAKHYSAELDSCLNAVFRILSEVCSK